jgi:predicted P-loop ATPase
MVFAATTNEETYLNDPTGNRRFWPIGVGEIDLEGLRADVEQLWAEAVQAFRDGEPWHIEDPSERALAESEQRTRLLPDSWEVYVSEYVDGRDAVSLNDVLENALEIERSRQTPQSVARVTRYLRRLGYGSAIRKGKKVWVRVR